MSRILVAIHVDRSDRWRDHINSLNVSLYDFDSLPVKINYNNCHIPFEMTNKSFRQDVILNFIENFTSKSAKNAWNIRADIEDVVVCDYCYVLMKKIGVPQERVFQFPGQSKYDCPEHLFRI